MATTTPNYGWTVPTSTDLVKDGATAIETLGDAIDASMNTALGTKKAGMVLLNTTSFSGVASQSINNVFTSAYKSYKILSRTTQSAQVAYSMRVRASGTDLTSSTYQWAYIFNLSNSSAYGSSANNGDTLIDLLGGGVGTGFYVFDINDPFASAKTAINWQGNMQTANPYAYNFKGAATVNNTTSYDGFTIFVGSGTMTGSISVYGYNE